MSKLLKIERIPDFASGFYALVARKAPFLKDFHKNVADEVTSRISSGRILDVGTGPGYLPLQIAKRSKHLEIVGIDLSPAMIEMATRNAETMGVAQRVKFRIGDAANLPFEDDYFDLVISTLSMHHWLKPTKCLKEDNRVLKKGGEAWIYEFRRDTTREVNAQLKARYGRFMSFLLLNIVRAHSSMYLNEVEEVLSSSEIGFSKRNIEDRGVVIKLRLSKASGT
ncbi:MAG: class I SAM-dependent methyltransferase [Candidatus Atabeyarchaeum deiterrae]